MNKKIRSEEPQNGKIKSIMHKKISKTGILIVLIVFLSIVVGAQYFQNLDLKYDLIIHKSIPHISLSNVQFELEGEFYPYIKGFVAFDNIADQPRDLRQYYIIKPLFKFDENRNQLFSLKEIIALYPLPPREIGEDVVLSKKEESDSSLTLEDEAGNLFFINKLTEKVTIYDVTGDETYLITDDLEYGDFMWEFLK